MQIMSSHEVAKSEITRFLTVHWGSPRVVLSGGIHQCDEQNGFLTKDHEDHLIALITFSIEQEACEITSLCSIDENKGTGTALMQKVEDVAKNQGCRRIHLTTTNDNLRALGFYQKRGYRLARLNASAVERAREIKPEIPILAENGIPIRDEIVLEKMLMPDDSAALHVFVNGEVPRS
ncbi:GNAT family N-acetyltransferase [Gorillibacterium massiliense]|uniref:GNAT family N-acetyltransferase n=1 Tax=Gorillibacterium massiliense TaxID=1280390 RepID=UPI0004B22FD7|nr:GNAT family N-acetyltransferase [Gorillibacterium massiliense]